MKHVNNKNDVEKLSAIPSTRNVPEQSPISAVPATDSEKKKNADDDTVNQVDTLTDQFEILEIPKASTA
jgi:hypothetical protein